MTCPDFVLYGDKEDLNVIEENNTRPTESRKTEFTRKWGGAELLKTFCSGIRRADIFREAIK